MTEQRTDGEAIAQGACNDLVAKIVRVDSDEPPFLCIWGDGYVVPSNPVMGVHPLSFFSQDNGYSDRNRDAINSLAFGESVTITGLAEVESIVRVR